jgi:hypothetical protein
MVTKLQRDPTAALLLALCNGDPGPAAQTHIAGLLAQPIDWLRLSDLAALHGVVGLVRRKLAALDLQSCVPAPAWQAMDAAATQIAFDAMLHLRETAGMAAALEQAGIQPLLLKGQALADLLYDDPLIRPASDIDLLIWRDEVEIAQEALAAIDYAPQSRQWLNRQLAHGYHISLGREVWSGRAVLLELHWDLGGRNLFGYDLAAWRSRSQPFVLSGAPAPLQRFSPEDQLLHLALHMRKHRYVGLRWLVDVAELLRRFQATLDWGYVTGAARQAGLTVLLYTSLTLAQRLLAAPVDPAVLARLEPAAWRRRLLQSLLSQAALLAPLEREDAGWTRLAPVEIALIDRPAAMARELGYRLLPPPEAVLGVAAQEMSRGQRLVFQARRLLDRGATLVE